MTYRFQWIQSIAACEQAAWDTLADRHAYPFLRWSWLHHLEASRSAVAAEGWQACHCLCFAGERLIGAAPLFLKDHSRGEFVFDSEWARVAHQIGVNYYPKLLGMSPFTPALGYRFLLAEDVDALALNRVLLDEIDRFCKQHRLAGLHLLHGAPDWVAQMTELGMGAWHHHGLIWENDRYPSFDDYLASFRSHQRKNIKRERRKVAELGVTFKVLAGDAVPDEYFDTMYAFYTDTCVKYWGYSHYLKHAFFQALARDFRQHVVLVCAYAPGEKAPIAMSFLIHDRDWLYGRYWGARDDYAFLHFETCYYQPIAWAIEQGVRFYDAGSGGGRQKKNRGFPARLKPSLHRFYHPLLQQIWDQNIDHLNAGEAIQIELINDYKKTVARLEAEGLIERES